MTFSRLCWNIHWVSSIFGKFTNKKYFIVKIKITKAGFKVIEKSRSNNKISHFLNLILDGFTHLEENLSLCNNHEIIKILFFPLFNYFKDNLRMPSNLKFLIIFFITLENICNNKEVR